MRIRAKSKIYTLDESEIYTIVYIIINLHPHGEPRIFSQDFVLRAIETLEVLFFRHITRLHVYEGVVHI